MHDHRRRRTAISITGPIFTGGIINADGLGDASLAPQPATVFIINGVTSFGGGGSKAGTISVTGKNTSSPAGIKVNGVSA